MHSRLLHFIGGMYIALLWSSAACLISGDTRVQNSNLFMDAVLLQRMPMFVRYDGLDPATLDAIPVVVHIKNWAGHKFKANFTINSVTGLSKGVHRLRDCAPVGIRSGNITVGCNIHFDGVHISLNGVGQGDSMFKNTHQVTATATLGNSFALVEAAGREPHKPGSLVRFSLAQMNLTVIPGNNIDLGKDRLAVFNMNLKKDLTSRVAELISGRYKSTLAQAIQSVYLPPV
ncbi:hypothetical protein BIW11_11244 [Tropilaelaps mercedesae]|uniref:Uncharacterized protein n=1 Tax=Tropilaelaps mercedesae TaxID=418985 RepID=A0A1V9XC93_9ACAR|nr:hypothetical protein BIW11_11244 [Tropilaelaps mercedesae]